MTNVRRTPWPRLTIGEAVAVYMYEQMEALGAIAQKAVNEVHTSFSLMAESASKELHKFEIQYSKWQAEGISE